MNKHIRNTCHTYEKWRELFSYAFIGIECSECITVYMA